MVYDLQVISVILLAPFYKKACFSVNGSDPLNYLLLFQDAIEECRKLCGGHGYLCSSGLPELFAVYVPACTYEGDNVVLLLQVYKLTWHSCEIQIDITASRYADFLFADVFEGVIFFSWRIYRVVS